MLIASEIKYLNKYTLLDRYVLYSFLRVAKYARSPEGARKNTSNTLGRLVRPFHCSVILPSSTA